MTISLQLVKNTDEIKVLLEIDDVGKDMELYDDVKSFVPNVYSNSWFKIKDSGMTVGVFVLQEVTNQCAAFHGGLFKEYRHQHTVKILLGCLDFIHKLIPYKLVTFVNSTNVAMVKVFHKANLVHKTTIKNGYKTGDMLVFGETE